MMSWLATIRGHRAAFNLLAAVVCAALVGYALFSQYQLGLEPCPLCIFQRIAVALLASMLIAVVALGGAGVAARHLYIQSLPPGQVPVCGATLDYMWDVFPAMDVLRKVLTGSGECAKVDWTFLGLAMPAWVLIMALLLGAFGVLLNWRSRR
jgi:disulfide bond formation protein DsbB